MIHVNDTRYFNGDNDHPTLNELKNLVMKINPNLILIIY